jgi:hypothetical protein
MVAMVAHMTAIPGSNTAPFQPTANSSQLLGVLPPGMTEYKVGRATGKNMKPQKD